MLKGFGAELWIEEVDGERVIHLRGEADLKPQQIEVPAIPRPRRSSPSRR